MVTNTWNPRVGSFRACAWKEVRIRSIAYDENEQEVRSSTTVALMCVVRVARHTLSLCVSRTTEVAGQEFSTEPKEITKELAPQVESSKVVGTETVRIGTQEYPAQVIQLITKSGARRETSKITIAARQLPTRSNVLQHRSDPQTPNNTTATTVTVTELNRMASVLGEQKCTWSVTTVIKTGNRTVTIREVHCCDVPGELVSQITEDRNGSGKLVSRRELELTRYGTGRFRRILGRMRECTGPPPIRGAAGRHGCRSLGLRERAFGVSTCFTPEPKC